MCSDGEVRLVDGENTTSLYSGQLEIFMEEEWGTVCDYGWDYQDAKVLCRQLGYLRVKRDTYRVATRAGDRRSIWRSNFGCNGNENSLLECYSELTIHCTHSYDVWTACSNGEPCIV